MPTGGGKSITFQVPALAVEGVCIVITPLIALMKDQVENLRRRGIRAAAIYSGMSRENIISTLENCIFGAYRILYVSPERLSSDYFLQKISHAKVSFITVDEAHCITQWGYDFRPSYLQITSFRKLFPDIPVLALTATATPAVIEDIMHQLGFRKPNVFRMSFQRPNLAYIVRKPVNRLEDIVQLLNGIEGSAIVYVQKRKDASSIAEYINSKGISATYYHAGLDTIDKNRRQQDWKSGNIRTIVATNAFGMGIDKPDVRLVIHYECPTSIEAYFQEAGRAGRDGKMSYSFLLYDGHDKSNLLKKIQASFPEKEYIRKVYDDIAYFYQIALGDGYNCRFEFNVQKFCHIFRHFPAQAIAAIKILEQSGYLEYTDDDDNMSRLKFILQRDELYRLRNNSPQEDLVVEKLLRNYGGLFVDYMFIDESLLADLLHLEATEPEEHTPLHSTQGNTTHQIHPKKRGQREARHSNECLRNKIRESHRTHKGNDCIFGKRQDVPKQTTVGILRRDVGSRLPCMRRLRSTKTFKSQRAMAQRLQPRQAIPLRQKASSH